MMRNFSQLLRYLKSAKEKNKTAATFKAWKKHLLQLAPYKPQKNKLLLVRLDDIGDFILFQNFISCYKVSDKWKDHHITLLGNKAWQPLFEMWHHHYVDEVLWIDKNKYMQEFDYRKQVWIQIREKGFNTVVCPSRTRPLLLDDCCTYASGASHCLGNRNTLPNTEWNGISDEGFSLLFDATDKRIHEFEFNRLFAEWVCESDLKNTTLSVVAGNKIVQNKIVCFIGASNKSKRYPARNWIELIKLMQENYDLEIILAGGNTDTVNADIIQSATGSVNLAGKRSLPEMIHLINESALVISNDTMAAHMAVCCKTPLVIISNGNNHYRFTDYGWMNAPVVTVYPSRFLTWLSQTGNKNKEYEEFVSADIAGINPGYVFEQVKSLLK